MEGQMDEAIPAIRVDDVVRPLVRRALGPVDVPVFAQQSRTVPAARADRPAAADAVTIDVHTVSRPGILDRDTAIGARKARVMIRDL